MLSRTGAVRELARWCLVGGVTVVLASCGGAAPSTSAPVGVAARVGSIEVIHPFLPQPASPSVAAVYLTLRNVGSVADELVSVSSPLAGHAALMTEEDHGSVGSMRMVTDLVLPPHGTATLTPGRAHAMLEEPTVALTVGRTVPVTLHFERAGSVTVSVPVVPFSDLLDGGGAG